MNDKIVSAQGENLSLVNVKGSKQNALSVYGKSMQSGTPSPDNPVPIVSAGSVMTTGAQLFDASLINGVQNNGISANANGSIKVTGMIEQTGGTNLYSQKFHLNEGEYSIGLSIGVDFYVSIVPYNSWISSLDCEIGNTSAHGFIEDGDYTLRFYRETESNENINFEVYVMINSGSTALPWEPYTGGVPGVNPYEGEINVTVSDGGTQSQTLILSTPGGLPGVPGYSGGNYTDESGQQWICDEIDLKRGVYVQYIKKIILDGTEGDWTERGDFAYGFYTGELMTKAICNYFSSAQSINDIGQTESIYAINSTFLVFTYLSAQDLDEWKIWLSQHPVTVYYALATPIETDLPAEEIADYQALHTYTPNTTVSNDTGAWVKVGYREWRR